MRKMLLLGGTGFVGSHMEKHCSGRFEVVSIGRDVDIRDSSQVLSLVDRVRPDDVVHLAAITTLKESFENPDYTFDVNVRGTLNLLTALNRTGFSGRLLFVSSSEVYGLLREDELPVAETRITKPMNPYAVSKVASEALCYEWSQSCGFKIVIARPFNHIGPGQSERFSISEFGRQIAMVKLGLVPPMINVGDIATTRDFTDVRDIVAAYELLLDLGQNGQVYNVCSGIERRIDSLINLMCEIAGVNVEIVSDAQRFRRSEQRRVYGCNHKVVSNTGWSSVYSINQTVSAIIKDWLKRLEG